MKSNNHKTGCMICGKELVYTETAQEVQCIYCNRTFSKNEKCIDGHYVCDRCHSASANELIQIVCTQTESEDPLEIAITLMRNPTVKNAKNSSARSSSPRTKASHDMTNSEIPWLTLKWRMTL
jgi:hypothetical protein